MAPDDGPLSVNRFGINSGYSKCNGRFDYVLRGTINFVVLIKNLKKIERDNSIIFYEFITIPKSLQLRLILFHISHLSIIKMMSL